MQAIRYGIFKQRKKDLFDEYECFRAIGNESIHDYFVRFHKLVNDMKITQLNIPTHQMNTKFVNNLMGLWGKMLTNVKLITGYLNHTFVQIYTHLIDTRPHAIDSQEIGAVLQIVIILSGFPKAFPTQQHPATGLLSNSKKTHATVYDGQIVTEPIQRKAPGNVGNTGVRGKKVICYNCRGEGHVARQCKEPKRKLKAFLADVDCSHLMINLRHTANNKSCFKPNHEDAYVSDVDEGPIAALLSWPTGWMHQENILTPMLRLELMQYDPYHHFLLDTEAQNVQTVKELSGDQAYWLSANEIASQANLRSACDREHTKVLELEAEISKQKQLISESEKRFAFLEQNYVCLQLKFQNYKQCIDTSSASNAIFEINKLRQQLQGKDDTIRNLDAQISIMKVLNVGSTEGSCDQQALETDRIQLKDTITSLRIQLDGLKVENVSLKRRYDELSQANTHSRTAYTEKLSALTAGNNQLKAQVTGKTSSGPSTSETPKVLAPGMYNLGSKYIPPPKRANWVKPTPLPKKRQVTFSEPPRPSLKPTQKPVVHPNKQTNVCVPMSTGVKPTSGASKTVPKRAPRNHSSLPVKSANARRVEAHHRTLNKKNRVDSNLLVKHSVSVSKLNNVCAACNKSLVIANHTDCLVMCDGSVNVKPHQTKRRKHQPKKEWKPIKRVWKPISKPVANSKPQWKPTGRHFSLFEKYPLTRIMEPTDMPIELPPSASSSPKITMVVQIVLWYLDSGCSRHMTGDRARLINFVEKFIGTVRFGNDEYAAIVGYGDYKLGDTIISRVYYVEGLKHNLFSVGQFCDGGLEVAFRQHSCHIRNYDMVDLLNGSRTTNLYSNTRIDMMSLTSLLLLTKASSMKLNEPLMLLFALSEQIMERSLSIRHSTDGLRVLVFLHERPYLVLHNRTRMSERLKPNSYGAVVLCSSLAKAPLFLWAEAVATACYTLNRSLVHTLHGKTYYELLKGKKPNLQYFRVFGSLCYPTNDYDDVGKLKAKADIGIFVGYAPTKKAYRIYNKRTRKIQETVHVAFDELTEGLTQESQPFSTSKKKPKPPSVPPTKKQVDDLFQWFDDDEVIPPPAVPIPPVNAHAAQAPENAIGSPSTIVISEGAPAVTESLLPHQIPLPDTSDSDIETLFDHVDSNVFDTYTAPETDSAASSSNTVNIDVTPNNQLPHVQKWTQAHSLENIIGDKDRPVSTRKQLETDAMWCFFNEFLSSPKLNQRLQAILRALIILLINPAHMDFQNKLDEYGDVLKTKLVILRKDIFQESLVLILRNHLLRLQIRSDHTLHCLRSKSEHGHLPDGRENRLPQRRTNEVVYVSQQKEFCNPEASSHGCTTQESSLRH
ncbi:integrase, catalytic region, zinc finger, CCHC-type containing protein [Tanacetum coccineum]